MTVKCLSKIEQTNICQMFIEGNYSLTQLARIYERSRRTIIRVLEEANIDPGVKHRKPKIKPISLQAAHAEMFPDEYTCAGYYMPVQMIETSRPWYSKLLDSLSNIKLFGLRQ